MKKIFFFLFCLSTVAFAQKKDYKTFKSFDRTKIAYDVKGDGEPIIMLHGFISNRKSWDNTAVYDTLLKSGYKLIRIDLRGMGDSEKPLESDAYADFAEVKDIMKLAKKLRLKHYSILGYSRGSILAANLMTKEKKRLDKVVLGGMGEHFTNPDWDRRIRFAEIYGGQADKYPGGKLAVMRAEAKGANPKILSHLQTHQPVTSPTDLAYVDIPVLVISGDKDRDNGDPAALARMLTNSRLKITDGNHGRAKRTKAFAAEVVAFFAERPI